MVAAFVVYTSQIKQELLGLATTFVVKMRGINAYHQEPKAVEIHNDSDWRPYNGYFVKRMKNYFNSD